MGSEKLKTLVLREVGVKSGGFETLLERLAPVLGLKELILDSIYDRGSPRGDLFDGITGFSLFLLPQRFPNLEALSLGPFGYLYNPRAAYDSLVCRLPLLRILRMAHCPYYLSTVPAIVAEHRPLLEELSLTSPYSGSDLDRSNFAIGVTALVEFCPCLTTLKLPKALAIPEDTWTVLLPKMFNMEVLECDWAGKDSFLLERLQKLRILTLTRMVEWQDVVSLAQVLQMLPNFSKLSLSGQWLFPHRARKLQALLPGVHLHYLRPELCSIRHTGD